MTRSLAPTFAAFLLVCSLPVDAQLNARQEQAENSEKFNSRVLALGEFKVIGSKDAAFMLSGSGYYLNQSDLTTFQVDDVNRALRLVPGVYQREEDGNGLFPNISLRGVDTARSGKLTVMEDGVLTAPATYSAPAAYYTPTTGRMSGVEILKGSSQIRYGPHTTGGAINYLSTPSPRESGSEMRLSFGSDDDIRATGRFGHVADTPEGRISVLAEMYYRENDGFKTIDGAGSYKGSEDTGFNRTDYMVKIGWEPEWVRYHYIEFKIGYTDLEAQETYLGLITEDLRKDPFRRYAASRNDVIHTNHTRLYLRHIFDPGGDARITTTGYFNKFHRNWFKLHDIRDIDTDGNGIPQGNEDSPDAENVPMSLSSALAGEGDCFGLGVLKGERAGKLRLRNNNRDYLMAGVQSEINFHLTTGDVAHEIETGLRYHRDRIRRLQWHNLVEQNQDGDFIEAIVSAPGSDGNRRQETGAFAFHFLDKVRIGKWTLLPGVRYEHLDYSYTDFTTDGSNEPVVDDSSDLGIWTSGISATYRANDKLVGFAGYHHGLSAPSPRNYVRNGIIEETSDAFEIGGRFSNRKGTYAEFVFFHTNFDDLIVIDNIGGTGTGNSENVGNIKSTGVELLLGFDPGRKNDWGFRNPYRLTFTYTDASLVGDANSDDPQSIFAGGRNGNDIPYIPRFQVNLSVGVELDRFSVYANFQYVDDTFTSATNSRAEVNPNMGVPDARFGVTDDRFLVDLTGRYRISENVKVFATLSNVLDEAYIASRHPRGPRPGAPRRASLGFEYRF